MVATWWSVLVEAEADDKHPPADDDAVIDALLDALADEYAGSVGGDARRYSARISIDGADQLYPGALWAAQTGCGIVTAAAMKVGLPDWPVVRVEAVRDALEGYGIAVTSSEVSLVPKTSVPLDETVAEQTMRLIERLEELDDVQDVYSNSEVSDEVAASLTG